MNDVRPDSTNRSLRLLAIIAATGLALGFIVLLIQQLTELSDRRLPCCDYSALELGTRAFLRGEQLTGMYSREGWRHPGPITFVWSALARLLPGRGFAEHQVATVAVHMMAIGVMVAMFRRRLSSTAFVVALAAMSVFVWRFDIDQFREPWNPFTAMTWAMAAVVLAAAFATRIGWTSLIGFVIVGSFAVQTHVGAAPVVLIASVFVGRNVYARRGDEGCRRALTTSALAFLVIWLLPIIDAVAGDGNLFDVATGTDRGWSTSTPWTSLIRLLAGGLSAMGRYFGPSSPYVAAGTPTVVEWLLVVAIVAVSVFVWRQRDRHAFAWRLTSLSWAGLILTGVLLQTTSGPFYRYLLLPVAGLAVLVWIAGLVVIVETVADRTPPLIIPVAAAIISLVVGVFSAVGVDSEHLVGIYGDERIDRTVNDIRANCDAIPDEVVVDVADVGEEVAWTEAMPVIVALDDCAHVTVTGLSGFIAGPGYEADDDAVANYRIDGFGWSAVVND